MSDIESSVSQPIKTLTWCQVRIAVVHKERRGRNVAPCGGHSVIAHRGPLAVTFAAALNEHDPSCHSSRQTATRTQPVKGYGRA